MSISIFDHPFLGGLLGDEEFCALLSPQAALDAMIRFEIELARAQAAEGLIGKDAADAIKRALSVFVPDMAKLRAATMRDGVVVAELVRQMRVAVGEEHGGAVHLGATSQDVIDTAQSLQLAGCIDGLEARLAQVIEALDDLDRRFGRIEVMAHTRMQAAIPVPAARKIASWRDPLMRHLERVQAAREEVVVLHFGGAAGTLDRLGGHGDAVSGALAAALGLRLQHPARHSERDGLAAFASTLSLVTGSLGKMGQDIALGAQSEIGEIRIRAGGGSSAMPHKVNPVAAEILVAQARFNATLLAGMHQSLVHENERSGAAWTLEWMILPQMVMTAATSLVTASRLLATIEFSSAA